jgi:hypothetical protein
MRMEPLHDGILTAVGRNENDRGEKQEGVKGCVGWLVFVEEEDKERRYKPACRRPVTNRASPIQRRCSVPKSRSAMMPNAVDKNEISLGCPF